MGYHLDMCLEDSAPRIENSFTKFSARLFTDSCAMSNVFHCVRKEGFDIAGIRICYDNATGGSVSKLYYLFPSRNGYVGLGEDNGLVIFWSVVQFPVMSIIVNNSS